MVFFEGAVADAIAAAAAVVVVADVGAIVVKEAHPRRDDVIHLSFRIQEIIFITQETKGGVSEGSCPLQKKRIGQEILLFFSSSSPNSINRGSSLPFFPSSFSPYLSLLPMR